MKLIEGSEPFSEATVWKRAIHLEGACGDERCTMARTVCRYSQRMFTFLLTTRPVTSWRDLLYIMWVFESFIEKPVRSITSLSQLLGCHE